MAGIKSGWLIIPALLAVQAVQAAQPLVTDDINTQGSGNHQLEFNVNQTRSVAGRTRDGGAVYTFGMSNPLDVAFGLPRQFSSSAGFGDASLIAKWRFFETESAGMALRPEIFLPTGNEREGLGTGALSTGLLWIGTLNLDHWSVHANLGMTLQRYQLAADREANRRSLWRISAAAVRRVNSQLQLVADTGLERNAERGNETLPAFLLVGAIYSPASNLDLDAGYRKGLNCGGCGAQVHRQFTAGITWRF